jgi:hypothetical protein
MKVKRTSSKIRNITDMLPDIVWATIRNGKRYPYYNPDTSKVSLPQSSPSSSWEYFIPNNLKIYPFITVFSPTMNDKKLVPKLYQKPLVLSKHLETRAGCENMYVCLQMVFCTDNLRDIRLIRPYVNPSINIKSLQRRSNCKSRRQQQQQQRQQLQQWHK